MSASNTGKVLKETKANRISIFPVEEKKYSPKKSQKHIKYIENLHAKILKCFSRSVDSGRCFLKRHSRFSTKLAMILWPATTLQFEQPS